MKTRLRGQREPGRRFTQPIINLSAEYCRQSQATTQVVFQAKTQAKNVLLNYHPGVRLPRRVGGVAEVDVYGIWELVVVGALSDGEFGEQIAELDHKRKKLSNLELPIILFNLPGA